MRKTKLLPPTANLTDVRTLLFLAIAGVTAASCDAAPGPELTAPESAVAESASPNPDPSMLGDHAPQGRVQVSPRRVALFRRNGDFSERFAFSATLHDSTGAAVPFSAPPTWTVAGDGASRIARSRLSDDGLAAEAETHSGTAGRDTLAASHGTASGQATITNWEWLEGGWLGRDWTRMGRSRCLVTTVASRRGAPVSLSEFQRVHALSLAAQTVEVASVSVVADGLAAQICIEARRPGTSRVVLSAWDTTSFRYAGSYQPHHVLAEPLVLRFPAGRWELGVGQAVPLVLQVGGSQGNAGAAPVSQTSVSSSRSDVAAIEEGAVARGVASGTATLLASYSGLDAEARVDVYEIAGIRTGDGVTCLLMRRGTVRCAGNKDRAAIGYGLGRPSPGDVLAFPDAPDMPLGGATVVEFGQGLGNRKLCVLQADASVRCWGSGHDGMLGYVEHTDVGYWNTPSEAGAVPVGTRVESIGMGEYHTCAVVAGSGAVRCWGLNSAGQLGYGSKEAAVGDDETPASFGDVPLGGRAVQVQGGRSSTCALMETGRVRCWGVNAEKWDSAGRKVQGRFYGLGYGDRFPPDQAIGDDETPASVGDLPLPGRVEKLAMGGYHLCALMAGGTTVRCWGSAWWGVLGDGVRGSSGRLQHIYDAADATELQFESPVIDLVSDYFHSCALLENGSVRCWGLGTAGALGLGHTRNIGDDEPATAAPPVPLGGPASAIAVHYQGGCAAMRAGGLRCWGAPSELGFIGVHLGDDEAPSTGGDVRIFPGPVRRATGHRALLAGAGVGASGNAQWPAAPGASRAWAVVSAGLQGPVIGPLGVLPPDSLPPLSSWARSMSRPPIR